MANLLIPGAGIVQAPSPGTPLLIPGAGVVWDASWGVIVGSVCWGHSTGVTEDNTRTFVSNWTGTGTASSSGDSETLDLDGGEYMISEVVETGTTHWYISQNVYNSGDSGTISYRTGNTVSACQAADWTAYSAPFASEGYVQIKVAN